MFITNANFDRYRINFWVTHQKLLLFIAGLIEITTHLKTSICEIMAWSQFMVEISGLEPLASWMPFKCSTNWAISPINSNCPPTISAKLAILKSKFFQNYKYSHQRCHCIIESTVSQKLDCKRCKENILNIKQKR